jgi:formate hydrogenlyase subunit 4
VSALIHLLAMMSLPILVVGVIARTKARWSGRKGPPLFQLAYDLARLVGKTPVYGETAGWVFRATPALALTAAVVGASVAPWCGIGAPLSFPFDFVWFAYVWGLGRVGLMLGALDTGSAFEGMGASREGTFAALLEPAFFLVAASVTLVTRTPTFTALTVLHPDTPAHLAIWAFSIVALVIVVQVEAARMPVDDPTTHLELTMIHEVMILDHAGSDLAALQAASAVKLVTGLGLVATLLNPWAGASPLVAFGAQLVLILLLAVALGTVESLVARLRMRAIPQYVAVALAAGAIALLATTATTVTAPVAAPIGAPVDLPPFHPSGAAR